MTNREKTIDNATNEELADIIYDFKYPRENSLLKDITSIKELEYCFSKEIRQTADEMFEELGYKLKKVVGGYQYYFHDNINDEIVIEITNIFNGEINISKYNINPKNIDILFITEKEFKSINKKIKEISKK